MARSRLAMALALALGCAALTGAAFAGPPDDPGKSENAPGQEKKAESPAPAPAATPPASPGKSESAPGQTKTSKAATPSKGKSASAKGKSEPQGGPKPAGHDGDHGNQGGRSAQAHDHVIVCHRTGSQSNPYVVINIPKTAWDEAHSPDTGSHPDLGNPPREDKLLADEGVVPGSKTVNGRTFTKADCVPTGGGGLLGGGGGGGNGGGGGGVTTPVTPTVVAPTIAPAAEEALGEVAGVQARIPAAKAAPKAKPRGGVLGALGAVAGEELPFTGLQLWIAALIGLGLVGAGFGARKAMR